MATNEDGTSDVPLTPDLDRLIGELETESARRRAEPGYPHDADARLHFELARRAPNPPATQSMSELIAKVQEAASLASVAPADATNATGARRRRRDAVGAPPEQGVGQVASLGLAAAAALEALALRLEQVEHQVRYLGPQAGEAIPAPSSPEADDTLTSWRGVLGEGLPTGARVLYAQSRADEVVAELRAAGIDAYGLTSTGSHHQPGPDVRHGELLSHLRAVADDALGAVVLTGVPEAMSAPVIGPVVAELGRVTGMAVIISSAPWWWRLRLGAVNADLSVGRPLEPDTWLHAFHGVAMVGTAQYDPSGQSYRVVVRAQP